MNNYLRTQLVITFDSVCAWVFVAHAAYVVLDRSWLTAGSVPPGKRAFVRSKALPDHPQTSKWVRWKAYHLETPNMQ